MINVPVEETYATCNTCVASRYGLQFCKGSIEHTPCKALTAYGSDTVKCDGISMRPMGPGSPNVNGFDTLEIHSRAACEEEHELGIAARDRMRALITTPGLQIERSGKNDWCRAAVS